MHKLDKKGMIMPEKRRKKPRKNCPVVLKSFQYLMKTNNALAEHVKLSFDMKQKNCCTTNHASSKLLSNAAKSLPV